MGKIWVALLQRSSNLVCFKSRWLWTTLGQRCGNFVFQPWLKYFQVKWLYNSLYCSRKMLNLKIFKLSCVWWKDWEDPSFLVLDKGFPGLIALANTSGFPTASAIFHVFHLTNMEILQQYWEKPRLTNLQCVLQAIPKHLQKLPNLERFS